MAERPDAVIVGGGLAGLACALELQRAGVGFLLLEAAERLGGRVQTDHVDGFLCDRGFQILLTAYPQARAILDYDDLRLGSFYPGALVRLDDGFHRVADPFRRPADALRSWRSPVGSPADKFRVLRLRAAALRGSLEELYSRPQTTALACLRARGFGEAIIERFFRPFLGGVFLELELSTSSRKLEFVFRMFALGDNALPGGGMGAIPAQMASRLPRECVRTSSPVVTVERGRAVLADGEEVRAPAMVVATDAFEAARLLQRSAAPSFHPATCLYFAAEVPPVREPVLVLNGTGRGPINSLCVPSEVAPSYAPPGHSLVSVSVVGAVSQDDGRLAAEVVAQAREWFGAAAESWRLLRIYRIARAVPAQPPEALEPVERAAEAAPGVFVCGDHMDMASIQGALASGRRAARAVQAFLQGQSPPR